MKFGESLYKDAVEADLIAAHWMASCVAHGGGNDLICLASRDTLPTSFDIPSIDLWKNAVISNGENLFEICSHDNVEGQKTDNVDHLLDFAGPSLDTGFRVSSLATSKKMALSPELVYIITSETTPLMARLRRKKLKIYYDGKRFLKGLAKDNYYPFIWTCMDGEPKFRDEKMLGKQFRKGPIDAERLNEFSRGIIEDTKGIMLPYLAPAASRGVSTHSKPEEFDPYLVDLAATCIRKFWQICLGGKISEESGDQPVQPGVPEFIEKIRARPT